MVKVDTAELLRGSLSNYTRSPQHILLVQSGSEASPVSEGEKNRLHFSTLGMGKNLHPF